MTAPAEDHVVEVEIGVDQRFRPVVQSLGNGCELGAKAADYRDHCTREAIAVSREKRVDLPAVHLLPGTWVAAGTREVTSRRTITPPARVEGS